MAENEARPRGSRGRRGDRGEREGVFEAQATGLRFSPRFPPSPHWGMTSTRLLNPFDELIGSKSLPSRSVSCAARRLSSVRRSQRTDGQRPSPRRRAGSAAGDRASPDLPVRQITPSAGLRLFAVVGPAHPQVGPAHARAERDQRAYRPRGRPARESPPGASRSAVRPRGASQQVRVGVGGGDHLEHAQLFARPPLDQRRGVEEGEAVQARRGAAAPCRRSRAHR